MPFQVLQHAIVAYFLINCLTSGNYFDSSISSEEVVKKIGGLTLRNLQILQFNTHEVFELIHDKKQSSKQTKFIGGALYPTVALFNHSCDPGCVRYFRGHSIHVHAIKNIKASNVVAENYGPIFTQQNKRDRRDQLQKIYRFDCECEPCADNWPMYDQMGTNQIRLR